MGSSTYSVKARGIRASADGLYTNSINQNFTQNVEQRIHESMEPSTAKLRESRDSESHPNSVPIILALDETGSMLGVPQYMVQDGLPHTMGGIIQRGVPDPQILFLAIGDHETDRHPLQVSQFESGDEELDNWLRKVYLEANGGGNGGESYMLAWYFAANHTVTDAWEKRGQKGFLFTVGDEPCLPSLSKEGVKRLMKDNIGAAYSENAAIKSKDLLEKAQEKWDVYHLHILEGTAGRSSVGYWRNLLGDHCIEVNDHREVAKIIADIVVSRSKRAEVPTLANGGGTKTEEEPRVTL